MSVLGDTNLFQELLCCHPRLEERCHGTPIEFVKSGRNIVRVFNNVRGGQEVQRQANGIDFLWMVALRHVPFLDNPRPK